MINFVGCIVVVIVVIAVVTWIIRWKKINVWPEDWSSDEEDIRHQPFVFPSINRDRWGQWFSE